MNEFMQKLAALRSLAAAAPAAAGHAVAAGARQVAALPGRAVDHYIDSSQAMDAARQARNDAMIRENFGTPENYARINAEYPTPGPINYGAAVGKVARGVGRAATSAEDLFARLLGIRSQQ